MVHVGILWGITSGIPESSPVNPQWKWATRVPKRSHCNHVFSRLRGKMEPAPTLRPLGFDETFKDSRFFLIVHPCSVAWDSWLYGRLQREVQVFLHLAGAQRPNGSDGQKPIKNRWCTKSNSFAKKHNRLFLIWRCLKMGPHGQLNGEDHHCPMGLGAPMATFQTHPYLTLTWSIYSIRFSPTKSHSNPLNHHKFPLKSH